MQEEPFSFSQTIENYKKLFKKMFSFLAGSASSKFNKHLPFLILLAAIFYYIYNFSLMSILSHVNYLTGAHDVGQYDQIIWLLSCFSAPYSTMGGISLFGFHVSFYCVLLAPLFWLWPNINMLYLAQSVFLALAAVPLFFYAKQRIKNSFAALSIGLSFLMFPALQNMNLENFHPEVLVVFFLTLALYFMLTQNFSLFYLFVFLSALGKEEMGLVIVFIGLYLLLFKKQIKPGLITLFFGLAWHLICFKLIFPLANNLNLFSLSQPLVYSHWFGGLAGNLFNLNFYWNSFFNPQVFTYLANLLAPTLFIPLLSPSILFIGLPALIINLLSNCGYFISIYYHYNYVTTVVIYFGLIEGVRTISQKFQAQRFQPWAAVSIGLVLLFSGYYLNSQLSRFPLKDHRKIIRDRRLTAQSPEALARVEALKLIPPAAKAAASYSLFPHLGHRKEIYLFPNPFQPAFWTEATPLPPVFEHVDYVAIVWGNHGREEQAIIRFLLNSPRFKKLYQEHDVLVLKRIDYKKAANSGVSYLLYNLDKKISVYDDFSEKLGVKTRGTLSLLYFPDSKHGFRNLFGEEIPVEKQFALELFGYVFIPESGRYQFKIESSAECLLEIDGQPAKGPFFLHKGFHKYKIKYLNYNQGLNLRLLVLPPRGKEFILPERYLQLIYNPSQFNNIVRQYEIKRSVLEAYNRKQANRILNGGFEKTYGNKPKEWRIECWQAAEADCSYVIDKTTVKKGRYSAKIDHHGLADSRWVQEIEVKPNTPYKLFGWIKTVGIPGQGEGAFLLIENTHMKTDSIRGTQDWKFVEVTGKTASGQDKITIQCRLGYFGAPNTGTAFFDGIGLKEQPSPDSWE